MKRACNIDDRGRKTRLTAGAVTGLCGLAALIARIWRGADFLLVVGVFLCLAGSFMIFEGLRGWCVLRAIGVKTRL